MGMCYTVRLALCPLLCVVLSEYRLKGNQWQAGVHEGVAQVRRPVFYHMTSMLRLTGLVISRLQAGEGKHLSRTLKFVDITVLRENNRCGQLSNARNRKDRRIQTTNSLGYLSGDLINLSIQLVLDINGNLHLLEKEVVGSADRVLSKSLQLREFDH